VRGMWTLTRPLIVLLLSGCLGCSSPVSTIELEAEFESRKVDIIKEQMQAGSLTRWSMLIIGRRISAAVLAPWGPCPDYESVRSLATEIEDYHDLLEWATAPAGPGFAVAVIGVIPDARPVRRIAGFAVVLVEFALGRSGELALSGAVRVNSFYVGTAFRDGSPARPWMWAHSTDFVGSASAGADSFTIDGHFVGNTYPHPSEWSFESWGHVREHGFRVVIDDR
jgi:hypothetical protein